MSLLIISYHGPQSMTATGQLVGELVEGLSERQIYVETIHRDRMPFRLKATLLQRYLIARAVDGMLFLLYCIMISSLIRGDSVLVFSNPPFVSGIIPFFQNRRNGVCYVEQDLFPWTAFLGNRKARKSLIFRLLRGIHHFCLRRASKVVVLSDGMRRIVSLDRVLKDNIQVISNWAIREEEALIRRTHLSEYLGYEKTNDMPLMIRYSGNLGRMHDMQIIEDAILRLSDRTDIRFNISGRGFYKDRLIQHTLRVSNLQVTDLVPIKELVLSIKSGDISIVSIAKGAENIVCPSKYYGILACGQPVLLIARKWSYIAREVLEHGVGYVIEPGDVESLVSRIDFLSKNRRVLQGLAERARSLYLKMYSRDISIDRYRSLFGRN